MVFNNQYSSLFRYFAVVEATDVNIENVITRTRTVIKHRQFNKFSRLKMADTLRYKPEVQVQFPMG